MGYIGPVTLILVHMSDNLIAC